MGSVTFIIAIITKAVTKGIRINVEEETEGLDSSVHGERAFYLR